MLVNQLIVTGRLGRDAELTYTPNGKAVSKFSIAVNQGQNQPAMWLNVVCWGELAERVVNKFSKGQEVFVQGRLSMRSYKDSHGVERYATEVIASSAQLTQYEPKQQHASSKVGDMPNDPLGELEDHPF